MAIVVGKRLFGGGCFDERGEFQLSLERSVTPLGVVSIHLVSFLWEGRSLASQCLLFCLKKKLHQVGRDQQQYLCSLSTHAPQIGAISIRVTSSSAVRDKKIWLFRRVLTKIVTHHHQLSIESMGMRCRTLIFRKAPHPQATANYRRSLLIAST